MKDHQKMPESSLVESGGKVKVETYDKLMIEYKWFRDEYYAIHEQLETYKRQNRNVLGLHERIKCLENQVATLTQKKINLHKTRKKLLAINKTFSMRLKQAYRDLLEYENCDAFAGEEE